MRSKCCPRASAIPVVNRKMARRSSMGFTSRQTRRSTGCCTNTRTTTSTLASASSASTDGRPRQRTPGSASGMGLGKRRSSVMVWALNWDVEDDGSVRKTRLVQKNVEDFRTVQHTKVYHKAHAKQGANGPPLDPDFQHGVKSGISDYTAKSCIQGYYALEDQLPDQDLGRCLKPGRRNVGDSGGAAVRTDIPAPPPDKRSIADNCSYGDECSAAALLNPQRFDDRGVPDRDFLIRRPKEELKALVESCDVEGVDFEALWEECVPLFDDGLPLVSLDAMLFVHTKKIEDRVAALHSGTGPGLAAYKGAL
ncbi:EF-hand domain-containing family member B [Durusdinium trenchii]|uniref:EF-hand domain-containing family member B n=1 Tax=Durusdinium trenchii TaxID=1381693 RepID=A0ABP0LRI7_9DINO